MWHWCWGRCCPLTGWPPRRSGGAHVRVHPISAIFRHVSKTNRRGKWIIGESRGRTKATLEPHPPLPPRPWAKQSRRWPLKEQFVTCQLLGWERMTVWKWQHQPSPWMLPMRAVNSRGQCAFLTWQHKAAYGVNIDLSVLWQDHRISQDLLTLDCQHRQTGANHSRERRQSSAGHTAGTEGVANIRFWLSQPSIGAQTQSGSREPGNRRVRVTNQPF